MVRIIEREECEFYNKIESLNNDLIEKANLYTKNCNCKCNTKEISMNGTVNKNIDALILSYFNCSNCKKKSY